MLIEIWKTAQIWREHDRTPVAPHQPDQVPKVIQPLFVVAACPDLAFHGNDSSASDQPQPSADWLVPATSTVTKGWG
jgi:hypothetical protein